MQMQGIGQNGCFQASWNKCNAYLQPSLQKIVKSSDHTCIQKFILFALRIRDFMIDFFLMPIQWIGRKAVVPCSHPPKQYALMDQSWENVWKIPQHRLNSDSPEKWVLVGEAYRSVSLDLRTPDNVKIHSTFYRYIKNGHSNLDIATIICFNPNDGFAHDSQLLKFDPSDGFAHDSSWDWLLKKGAISPVPFHLVVFDYRNHKLNRFEKLILDADAVYQAVASFISEKNIHFIGYSLGGAISVQVASMHPESGRVINRQSFSNLTAVMQYSQTVTRKIREALPKPIANFVLLPTSRWLIANIFAIAGWSFDVRPALKKIENRTLCLYDPKDPMIPEKIATGNALSKHLYFRQNLPLSLKYGVKIACKDAEVNYHCIPLSFLRAGRDSTLNATKVILNFILGTEFKKKALPGIPTRVIDKNGVFKLLKKDDKGFS